MKNSHTYKKSSIFVFPLFLTINFFITVLSNFPQSLRLMFIPDPSYVYLLNGYQYVTGNSVYHVDHPGSTTQIIFGISSFLIWVFNFSGIGFKEFVIQNPDFLILTFQLLTSILHVYLISLIFNRVRDKSGNITAFFTAFAPMYAINTYAGFNYWTIAASDSTALILIEILLLYLIRLNEGKGFFKKNKQYIIFGILMGLLLMTKLNATPVVILIFLVSGLKYKIKVLIATLIVTTVMIYRISNQLEALTEWVKKLLLKSGRHGSGEGFVNLKEFLDNLDKFTTDWRIVPFLLLLNILGIYLTWTHKDIFNQELKSISIVTLLISIEVILYARSGTQHYFLLSWPFIAYTYGIILRINENVEIIKMHKYISLFIKYSPLIVFYEITSNNTIIFILTAVIIFLKINRKAAAKYIYISLILIISLNITLANIKTFREFSKVRAQNIEFHNENKSQNKNIAYALNAPSVEAALFFGNNFAGHEFTDGINRNYSNPIFVDTKISDKVGEDNIHIKFIDLDSSIISCTEINKRLGSEIQLELDDYSMNSMYKNQDLNLVVEGMKIINKTMIHNNQITRITIEDYRCIP
jgi:hypothetical protein